MKYNSKNIKNKFIADLIESHPYISSYFEDNNFDVRGKEKLTLEDFFKEYRKISNYFYKRAKRDIEKEELLEAFEENKEEFESLEEEKLTLMKKFIEADVSDENYDRFRKLDYKEDLVYKLFEKVSAPAKKLGEEIIEFLEKKEVLKKEHKDEPYVVFGIDAAIDRIRA